ncbi:PREDICTED: uncharacterized protein LOC109355950 isoform X2 [Lupinus angustifolius]|uniref:uncharacterized protein LOC109355950 isoform X2 n=1 Tax=Lupinus angustifolius TaxID=3871 RepID=UPI00092E7497|nr:PREDICTED: uncharacterized protein LOC109355950 isoform X2 [Lupinus angustifolius]
MKSLSSIGLGLSIVFCCLLLALVVEVYYLLWWKKRITNREIENDHGNPMKEIFYMFCYKRPSSTITTTTTCYTSQELGSSMIIGDTLVHEQVQSSSQNSKEFLFKPFGEENNGHPRFLFTIVEESKEDLESEDGKSRKGSRGKSLSDLLVVETPYLTPNSSPSFFTPIISPYNQHGFNPFLESTTDEEFNRMKSSPPPKFKFLQEAEEKLRRKLEDDENNKGKTRDEVVDDGSFITLVVDKKIEREFIHNSHQSKYHSSTSSQVLPLAS